MSAGLPAFVPRGGEAAREQDRRDVVPKVSATSRAERLPRASDHRRRDVLR